MKISVIIPVLNKWELTKACLESLRKHTTGELEVILIDNASSDATPVEAPLLGVSLFGAEFVYLRQPENRNFSASCNIGARAATGDLLFFLNNDTILRPNWLPPLLAALSGEKDLGFKVPSLVGPLLLYPELGGRFDRVQHLGLVFEPQLYPKHFYEGFPASHPLCAKYRSFQAITGAAILMRRALFLSCGLFDEDFINGGEDVELGLRLSAAGHVCAVVPESAIYHLASQTPGIHAHHLHNAKVLKDKAVKLIVPDLHILGAADGYELKLHPSLQPYLGLPKRREELLRKRYAAQPVEAELEEALLKEPCWREGYSLLADIQERTGRKRQAAETIFLSLRLNRGGFFEAKRLASLAEQENIPHYVTYALMVLKSYFLSEFDSFVEEAESMQKFYAELGNEQLSKLYGDWLSQKKEYKNLFGQAESLRSLKRAQL